MDSLFFLMGKLLWAAARPDTLVLAALAGALLALRRGRLGAARGLLGATPALLLALAVLPLGDLLLLPLERSHPPAPPLGEVAGILVLGGSEDVEPALAWGLPLANDAGDRLIAAAALARRFPEAPVLLIGGSGALLGAAVPEARLSQRVLLDLGVAPERLLLEERSRTTAENAAFSLPLAPAGRSGSWVLVTSAFHMPRAMATFCAAGWTGLVAWPTDHRSLGGAIRPDWDLAGHLAGLNLAAREWIGWLAYRVTGRLGAASCAAE